MPRLPVAIEHLYRAFEAVPKPDRIDGCPCCIERKEVDTLLARPLRELTPDDLSSYAFSALLTVGCRENYLYYLPRILEITATEMDWLPDPEMTARKIRTTDLGTWTPAQRIGLTRYFDAVVAETLADQRPERLDDWICTIALAGVEVQPYLDRIARVPAAVLELFKENVRTLPEGRLANAF